MALSSPIKRRQGQGAVEFIFALVAIFVGIFFVTDIVRIGYAWAGVQYATSRGIRTIKLLPTESPDTVKDAEIKKEIQRVIAPLGITLSSADINIEFLGNDVIVETLKPVQINRLSDFLISFGGDHSGVFDLRVKEVVRNESL